MSHRDQICGEFTVMPTSQKRRCFCQRGPVIECCPRCGGLTLITPCRALRNDQRSARRPVGSSDQPSRRSINPQSPSREKVTTRIATIPSTIR